MKGNDNASPELTGLWQLLSTHKPNNKSFLYMTLLIIVATGLELVIPLYSRHLVDNINQLGFDYVVILGLVFVVVIAAISEGALAWYGARMGENTNLSLRYSLIGRLVNTKQAILNNEHSAELSARIMNDSASVKSILAEDLIGLISGVISLIAVIVVMFLLDWRLTLVLLACIAIGALVITPLALSMRGIGKAMQDAEADLFTYVSECFKSGKMIRAHNAKQSVLNRSKGLLNNSFHHAMREARVVSMINPISNLVLMMSMVAILAFSAHWIAQGSMTLGTVTAFLMYLFGLAFPLISLGMFFSNLQKAAGAAVRLNEINQYEMESEGGNLELKKLSSIRLNKLKFEADGKLILTDINLAFSAAGLTVILGESGSGKSTLIQQLLGFYHETQSNILVNELPFTDYQLNSVRGSMAWVDQEPRLFHASIRENLLLGLTTVPSDEEIMACIEQVGLLSWFNKINGDLDILVSEQQQLFSGGEKQRFAIARALLRKPQLLVLDEPSSALDKDNEASIMSLLRHMSANIHVVMVTHNKQLISPSDHVVTLENGRISKTCQRVA